MKKIIAAGLSFAALAALSLEMTRNVVAGPGPSTASVSAPATQAGGENTAVATVHLGDIKLDIHAGGYLEAVEGLEVRIEPKAYTGELKIAAIAGNGAHVKKGDTLLRVDPADYDRQLAAAKNEAVLAHANLDKARSDVTLGDQADALAMTVQKDRQALAQLSVTWWEKVDGPVQLAIAGYTARQWDYQLADAQDELNELKKMYKSEELTNETTSIVMKKAEQGITLAKIADTIENEQADEFSKFHYDFLHRDVAAAANASAQTTSQLQAQQTQAKALRQTTLVSAQAAADAADRKATDLQSDGDQLTVAAPSDGIVLYGQLVSGNWQNADERALGVGKVVAPKQALLTFFTPGNVRATVDLTESQFFSVPAHAKSTVSPSAFADVFLNGTCEASVPQGHATPTGMQYALHISLPSRDERLIPGMHVSVSITSDLARNVLIVPLTALSAGQVWVRDASGKTQARDVVLGVCDGSVIEVRKGLAEGDQIMTHAKK